MDAADVLIRVAAVIGVGAGASFIGYGIPAILRRVRAKKPGRDTSAQVSARDDRLAHE